MEEARYECNKFKLVGFIPSNINQHSKLNTLSLDDNMLNGKILNWCFTLPSLSLSSSTNLSGLVEFHLYSKVRKL
ncbi:hypothetical protein MTR_5g086420 [Medicago truncatula]|uniref:Non-specific serine/threonine protein kinase n=1 Tax=Medicago truncatula TaxID=3880 RepID=G7KCN2_MEDTR|nr:hypothetical protein MTR_5g086420 [Medicago truncatula]